MGLHLRLATRGDIPQLHELIAISVRQLMSAEYSTSQLEKALGNWLGLDTQLVEDGTYFVVEADEAPGLVGCGGWSFRRTPFGSDHREGRENSKLDPQTDAAKIRAFFVHPDWARKGIGRLLLEASEDAARKAGFTKAEMGATLTGIPLYEYFGYHRGDQVDLPMEGGEVLPIVKMYKTLLG